MISVSTKSLPTVFALYPSLRPGQPRTSALRVPKMLAGVFLHPSGQSWPAARPQEPRLSSARGRPLVLGDCTDAEGANNPAVLYPSELHRVA